MFVKFEGKWVVLMLKFMLILVLKFMLILYLPRLAMPLCFNLRSKLSC